MESQSNSENVLPYATSAALPPVARLPYVTPTLTRMELSAVIAGAGGSQNDNDFVTNKHLGQ